MIRRRNINIIML